MTRITIKAAPALATRAAVYAYVTELIELHVELAAYRYALVDIVNTSHDDVVEVYNFARVQDDGYLDASNGTYLLWLPDLGRAALNNYQSGDWQWTDAVSPDDALRRFSEDDMSP